MAGEPKLRLRPALTTGPRARRALAAMLFGLLAFVALCLRQSKNDLAVYRQRLQDDVIAVAVLVHERCTDVEPKVILAFTFDDGVRLVGGLGSHMKLLSVRCGCWSVLVGAHDGEHALRRAWVGGVFRAAVQIEGVVVDLEEV